MLNILYYVCQFFLFISIMILCFLIVNKIFNYQYLKIITDKIHLINEEYLHELAARREKQKKLRLKKNKSLLHKLNTLIYRAGIRSYPHLWFVSPFFIILLCILSSLISFFTFSSAFKVLLVGLILSIPGFLLPIMILEAIAHKREALIGKILTTYLLQLKNHTRIHNDIIEAFRSVQNDCVEPLKSFTNQFIVEINSGLSVEAAIDNFKEKINLNQFKLFLTNVQYCYVYGGSFTELLDKTYKLISEIEKEKKIRIRETLSARLVLYILIFLDLFMYFRFINTHPAYMNILQTTAIGQFILVMNALSICFLLWLSSSVKKLDY